MDGHVQALLEKVFSTGQPTVISNTVARLAPRDAAQLFGEAVGRLHSRPARAAMLLPWLRALLLSHSSYLAVSRAAKSHVSTLQQLVAARVALLEPMLALRGRIDFVLAHAASQRAEATGVADKPPLVRPVAWTLGACAAQLDCVDRALALRAERDDFRRLAVPRRRCSSDCACRRS